MSTNRKFESLVLESWAVLPDMQRRIKAAREELDGLQDQCRDWRRRYDQLQMLAQQISSLMLSVSELQRQFDKLAYNRDL